MKPFKRPEVLYGTTPIANTMCGDIYVTINHDEEGNIVEVIGSLGKSGTCASANCEAMGRLVSIALQEGVEISKLIRTLKGIKCGNNGEGPVSCATAIATLIETEVRQIEQKRSEMIRKEQDAEVQFSTSGASAA